MSHPVPRSMAQRPAAFVSRYQLGKLVELLCKAAAQQAAGASVGITTALRGAGGFGKTTLAQQLCCEPEVQRAYPDGILWVTMGEHVTESGRIGRVLDLIRWWSTSEPPAFTDVSAASAELRRLLAGRRVLVVVDDVWQSADLAPFQGLAAGVTVLVTTRDRRLLPPDNQIQVDAMDQGEAMALLGAGLPDEPAAVLQPLAERLGYWPLVLDLVNRQLRVLVAESELSVTEAVAEVLRLLDQEGLTAVDLVDDDARRTAVSRTMAVSLRRLGNEDRERYELLAIVPEDIELPLSMLARYWAMGEGATRKLCERLHGLSLLQHFDRRAQTIGLHDVFRQYLIDIQRATLPALHGQWLDRLRPASGCWSDLPQDEPYVWQHLAYHLRHAGQGDHLRALLFDFAWLDAKLRATDIHALLADFEYIEPSLDHDREARLVRDALRLASHVLAVDAGQLPGQLIGRLGYFEGNDAGVSHLLTQTRSLARTPWLCPLRPSLMAPGGALERTLKGHSGGVWAVAVTSDGWQVLSGSIDGTLKVWDLAAGRLERTLEGHSGWVTAVAVTPDGRQVFSGSEDRTLKVWDLAAGRLERTLEGHSSWVTAVVVTPDGRQVLSGSGDGTLKVWDLAAGRPERTLEGHSVWVDAAAVTLDGRHAVSASMDGTLKLWELASGRVVDTFTGDSGMRCVACSASVAIVAGDMLGRIHILQLITESTSQPAVLSAPAAAPSRSSEGARPSIARPIEEKASMHTSKPDDRADLAILVALDEEFEQLHELLGSTATPVRDPEHGGYSYLFARPAPDGSTYQCVATMIGGMGPDAAGLVADRLIARWKPRVFAMLGIAAALHEDIKLADVVLAEQVDAYAANLKAIPDSQDGYELQHRGRVYAGDHALLAEVAHLRFAHRAIYDHWQAACSQDLARQVPRAEDRDRLHASQWLTSKPGVHRVHLASGPVVGAAAAFRTWLHQRNATIKALEMEAAGLVEAAHRRIDPVRTLVIRGISDLGDERKSELDRIDGGAIRRLAMRNATRFLWALLDAGVLPLRRP